MNNTFSLEPQNFKVDERRNNLRQRGTRGSGISSFPPPKKCIERDDTSTETTSRMSYALTACIPNDSQCISLNDDVMISHQRNGKHSEEAILQLKHFFALNEDQLRPHQNLKTKESLLKEGRIPFTSISIEKMLSTTVPTTNSLKKVGNSTNLHLDSVSLTIDAFSKAVERVDNAENIHRLKNKLYSGLTHIQMCSHIPRIDDNEEEWGYFVDTNNMGLKKSISKNISKNISNKEDVNKL